MTTNYFHEDYSGPRFTYGLRSRPFDIGTVPDGYIIGSLDEDNNRPEHRFGTIDYPAELSAELVNKFEIRKVFMPNTGKALTYLLSTERCMCWEIDGDSKCAACVASLALDEWEQLQQSGENKNDK